MVFIIIVILSLIATYLLISSGVFKDLKWKRKGDDDDTDVYDIDELEPGMLGSAPSDDIDVYDARKPIVIPMEGAINTLIESFKENANKVYVDFKNNRNSSKYKEYIFNDYKLELLRRNDALSEEQLNKYFTIRNTIVNDINNVFTYYLDKIKYSEDKSYFTLKRDILNTNGTGLLLTDQNLDNISNYVLSNTDIPGAVILLIKYKISIPAQELIDQIVMLAGYNYTTVLETLEQVMVREPLPGISLLGIVNSPSSKTVKEFTTVAQGFWTQVYFTLKSNNIDNFLISLIRLSFMTESIYRAILASVVSKLQNPRIADAMNDLIKMCRLSNSRIIKTFPYNFTHALLTDAIKENRIMLKINNSINVAQLDRETTGISNIENYANIEINFPVSIQNIVAKQSNDTTEFNYENPIYPILSDQYMTNNYLSFPNIKHRGVYFDRTNAVSAGASGYIMITNTATLMDLTIAGIIIYATLQDGFINDDSKDISNTIVDSNIVSNSALITLESGKYVSPNFNDGTSEPVTSNWLSGDTIIIPAGKSIRIFATKQVSTIGVRYLRIYSILIPFVTKPISDFLRISVIHDRANATDDRFNHFQFKNIPSVMPNLLISFDSVYNIATIASRVSDTFRIFNNNITTGNHSRIKITGATGSALTTVNETGQAKSTMFASDGTIQTLSLPSDTGLVTDSRAFSASNPNASRNSFRIRLKNTNTSSQSITINKMIVFGNTSSDNSFTRAVAFNGYVADDNVLLRNTLITAFTMNDAENQISESGLTDFIIDPNNSTATPYILEAGKSIFIEPTISQYTSLANRYVCVRAMYLEFSGSSKSSLSISIISLNSTGNKIATLPDDLTVMNDGALFIVLNPIGSGASTYSSFTILPEYKYDHYSTLPRYMEDRFQSDYYDQYYNPVSELVQYPNY